MLILTLLCFPLLLSRVLQRNRIWPIQPNLWLFHLCFRSLSLLLGFITNNLLVGPKVLLLLPDLFVPEVLHTLVQLSASLLPLTSNLLYELIHNMELVLLAIIESRQ